MRILALETTERIASIAALAEDMLLSSATLGPHERSAQSLAPGLRDLLQKVDWSPQDVQLVAVSNGPGSFTGLRVGVTTAKTFAYAVGAEVLAVNTLEAIASRAPREIGSLKVVLDAQRNQVFCGTLDREPSGTFAWRVKTRIVDNSQWLDSLEPGATVTGPALGKLAESLPEGVKALPPEYWKPTAEAVGQLAWHLHNTGQRNDLWTLVPQYFRKSAAEEKLEQ